MKIEDIVNKIEKLIELSYADMKKLGWISEGANIPDRNSECFIDIATARLILIYGFCDGIKISFLMKEHILSGQYNK